MGVKGVGSGGWWGWVGEGEVGIRGGGEVWR